MAKNYCINFTRQPGVNGIPEEDCFSYEECDYPEVNDQEMLIKSLYLSVDPIQRTQMNKESGLSFFVPYEIGKTISGLYGVGVVTESKLDGFKVGDVVINSTMTSWPWQLYFKTSNTDKKFTKEVMSGDDPKFELTYYGLPGITTLLGLEEQSEIMGNNGQGKSFVVTGAAGSCGHLAGQIAKLNGCTPVIGVCGTDEKCNLLKDKLKFTDAINYKAENVKDRLKELCPNGVDVYFDNVGGELADDIISSMNENGQVILCGQISSYNTDAPYPNKLTDETEAYVKKMKIKREPFVSLMHSDKFERVRKDLFKLKHDHGVEVLESMETGLEKMGSAFCSMMKGGNIGKQFVKVADL